MDEQPASRSRGGREGIRYRSLRDYVGVLRRHRLLIALLALIVAGTALAASLSQEESYEATASLSFRDPTQDLALIGGTPSPEQLPATRAELSSQLVRTPEVARAASRELHREQLRRERKAAGSEGGGDREQGSRERRDRRPELSPAELIDAVETSVDLNTNLVEITATAPEPEVAASIANAFARQTRRVESERQQERLEAAERSLEEEEEEAVRRARRNETGSFTVSSLSLQLAEVRALLEIASPVQVAEQATVPDSPAAPEPLRNTALGLLAGLVLGLIAAFVRDALDRRLRTSAEAHEELDLPVLGRVLDSAFGHPGLARHDGQVMSEADFEAFRVLRTNLGYLRSTEGLRSVLVTSGLPGEGKSTVSLGLASAAAAAGQRTLLVECDLRRPCFAERLDVGATPGLADYLRGEAEPEAVVGTVPLHAPHGESGAEAEHPEPVASLAYITAGAHSGDAVELLDSRRFHDFLGTVSVAYDLVVLDGAPLLSVVDPMRIAASVDALLICLRARQSTRDEARAIAETLANLPERGAGAVITGLRRGGPDAYEYYSGY